MIDRKRVERLLEGEDHRFEQASRSLLNGVPMNWMEKWPSPFPPFMDRAKGARLWDADGNEYIDFCLGDTGAMAGHSPPATAQAIARQGANGITAILPTEDAIWVGEELTRRFGLGIWQISMTATDANRFALRVARHITGRDKVLVFNWCYHGTVDETLAVLDDGRVVRRPGVVGSTRDPTETTRVVEYNDVTALERELRHVDVACVLCEPALTNIGIILPDPGFHQQLRSLTREYGSLLVIDETHTLCAGPGGMTASENPNPDLLVVGKSIGGGVPVAAFGMTEEVAAAASEAVREPHLNISGLGGTLFEQRTRGRSNPRNPVRRAARGRLRAHHHTRTAMGRRRTPGTDVSRTGLAGHSARLSSRMVAGTRPHSPTSRRRDRRRCRALHPPSRTQPGRPPHALPQHGIDVPPDDRSRRRPPDGNVHKRLECLVRSGLALRFPTLLGLIGALSRRRRPSSSARDERHRCATASRSDGPVDAQGGDDHRGSSELPSR
jgi:glutamate-1-semialdehyde 2,1-aminomutase